MERKKIPELVSLTEAAKIRNTTHQAVLELVNKERFTVYEISDHVYLSKREVSDYKPARAGRPKKQKEKNGPR